MSAKLVEGASSASVDTSDFKASPSTCNRTPRPARPSAPPAHVIEEQPLQAFTSGCNSIATTSSADIHVANSGTTSLVVPVPNQPVFDASLLDATSRSLYLSVGDAHKSGAELQTLISDASVRLLQTVNDDANTQEKHMTFDELLQGLLFRGEWIIARERRLAYSRAMLYDNEQEIPTGAVGGGGGRGGGGSGVELEDLAAGIAIITNQRLLLLSSSSGQVLSLSKSSSSGAAKTEIYEMSARLLEHVRYKPLPLRNIASVELNVLKITTATTCLRPSRSCCACCTVCCMLCLPCWSVGRKRWKESSTGPAASTHTPDVNLRLLKIGVRLPPWDRRASLHLQLDEDVPLAVAKDFIALLQSHSALSSKK